MPLDEFYFLKTNRNKILALNNEIQSLSEKIEMTKKALKENEASLEFREEYVANNENPDQLEHQVDAQKKLIHGFIRNIWWKKIKRRTCSSRCKK